MRVRNLWREVSGTTAVEYAQIATLISIAVMAGMSLLGGSFASMIGDAEREVEHVVHKP